MKVMFSGPKTNQTEREKDARNRREKGEEEPRLGAFQAGNQAFVSWFRFNEAPR